MSSCQALLLDFSVDFLSLFIFFSSTFSTRFEKDSRQRKMNCEKHLSSQHLQSRIKTVETFQENFMFSLSFEK